jgi:hypothetical protein
MVLITSIGTDYFEVNGKRFAKIYQPLHQGSESVGIYNIHETAQRALNSTKYDEFNINGVDNFADKEAVVAALLPVVYRFNGEVTGTSVIQWGAIIGEIGNQTDLINLVSGNTPVENEYLTRVEMLADQANQTNGFWQFVTDARSAQEVIDAVELYSAYFQYLGLLNALISDYRQISGGEVALTNQSSSWKTKQVKQKVDVVPSIDLVEAGYVFASTAGTGFVTKIYFDADYSSALVGSVAMYEDGNSMYIRVYNSTQKKFVYGVLKELAAFEVVNGLLAIEFENTIETADVSVGDYLQFEIPSIDNEGTGTGSSETAASIKEKYESNLDTNEFNDAEKAKLANLEDGAQVNNVSQTQTDFISGLIPLPVDSSYKLVLKAPYSGTITETTTQSVSGTCTATFKINTTALGGAANSVSSTEESQAHASANAFAIGDDIVLTVSLNATCVDMSFTIKFTKTLS